MNVKIQLGSRSNFLTDTQYTATPLGNAHTPWVVKLPRGDQGLSNGGSSLFLRHLGAEIISVLCEKCLPSG